MGALGLSRAIAAGTPRKSRKLELSKLLSQVEVIITAQLAPLVEQTRKALENLAEGKTSEPVDVDARIAPLLKALVEVLLTEVAAAVDGGRVANSHKCPCGKHYRFVRKQKRWLGFLFGQVQPLRAMYRCKACSRTQIPLDHVWGLQSGFYAMRRRYLTPRAQEMLAQLCVAMPFAEARRHFQQLTGLQISNMMGWRLIQHLGSQLQHQQMAASSCARRAASETLRWFIGADGVMVAFWKKGKLRRARKANTGGEPKKAKQANRIEWREVKVGIVARLDAAGAVVQGSQSYIIGLMKAEAFRKQLARMSRARGVRPTDIVAVVTDGAKWLRALWSRHFPYAIAVRDFFHATEHLGVMAVALYGEGSRKAARWQKKMAHRLKAGEIAGMLADWENIRQVPKDKRIWRREKEYFRSQQAAMAYADFQEANLPIGSGAVEGACKNSVGSRFKRPGARWSEEGFSNLAVLRARYCGGEPLMPAAT